MSASNQTLVALISVLMVSSMILECIKQPKQEILSECVCWSIILASTALSTHFIRTKAKSFNSTYLSAIAFGITLNCLSSSIQKRVWFTAPLLGVFIALIQSRRNLLPQHEEMEERLTTSRTSMAYLCVHTVITIIGLSQAEPQIGAHLEICWLFSQTLLFWGLSNRIPQRDDTRADIFAEAVLTLSELSYFMVPITLSLVILEWHHMHIAPEIGVFALFKALKVLTVFALSCYQTRLSVAAWSTIFSVCIYSLSTHLQTWQALLTVFGAFGCLWNIAATFPRSYIARLVIMVFALCPLWAFMTHDGLLSTSIITFRYKPGLDELKPNMETHPIQRMFREAKVAFAKTIQTQSNNLAQAAAEYERRYGRKPPPGFDQWYNFAVANKVQFIDEYDYMTKSFDPFWNIAPKILRDYTGQAINLENSNLNTLTIKNHVASLSRGSFQHNQLVELIKPIVHLLPDLIAALNEFDEPRVLVPHDKIKSTMLEETDEPQQVYIGVQDKQKIWETITIACSPDSPARSPRHNEEFGTGPRFVTNLSASQDVCKWTSSSVDRHGFLSSPSSFHFTHSYVPVMTTAKFSVFSDIMIPSSYYFQDDIANMNESQDSTWEAKKDQLYWRGSGTGGHWTHGSWKMGHRQRFVNFTNTADRDIIVLKKVESVWTPQHALLSAIGDKFKVQFSNFIQCDDEDCKAQEEYFHKAPWDSNNDAIQSKIVYNIDGNSFSGRYYRLLKSNSLVFMQALFKEWHDDRLIPWVHFVPISNSMEELPETTRYLLDDPEGMFIAKRIANEGRDWAKKVLRRIDLTAAYYRVFLEYARLMDDNRGKLV